MVEVVSKDALDEILNIIKQREMETPKEQSVKNNVVYEISEYVDDHTFEAVDPETEEPAQMEGL